jgi:hypothetical protein
MSEDTPFETWRLANIPQVAMSPEILKLVALAFEGGFVRREWHRLTDEEITACWESEMNGNVYTKRSVYEAIEAKLKEKNT